MTSYPVTRLHIYQFARLSVSLSLRDADAAAAVYQVIDGDRHGSPAAAAAEIERRDQMLS